MAGRQQVDPSSIGRGPHSHHRTAATACAGAAASTQLRRQRPSSGRPGRRRGARRLPWMSSVALPSAAACRVSPGRPPTAADAPAATVPLGLICEQQRCIRGARQRHEGRAALDHRLRRAVAATATATADVAAARLAAGRAPELQERPQQRRDRPLHGRSHPTRAMPRAAGGSWAGAHGLRRRSRRQAAAAARHDVLRDDPPARPAVLLLLLLRLPSAKA